MDRRKRTVPKPLARSAGRRTRSPRDDAALFDAIVSGDGEELDRAFVVLYEDLRTIAARHLKGERPGHTLRPTALVHEIYLRLAGAPGVGRPRGRAQFLALAARAMRRVLVDHARRRLRVKRRGLHPLQVTLDADAEPATGSETRTVDVLAVDRALRNLEKLHERQARVVEMRAFAGLTIDETAEVLRVSTDTVEDDWAFARTWLWRELQGIGERPARDAATRARRSGAVSGGRRA